MKKRFLSLLCVLALCLGLLPVTALAVDAPATLYVGNQQVIRGTETTYWSTNNSGELTQSAENNAWNVKYDPNTVTLTLKNATIEGEYDDVNISGAGIYAASSSGPVSLNIVLEEENKVSGWNGINVSSGGDASLNISGSGSLTVSGLSGNGIGIFMSSQNSANLTIEEASVTALGSQNGGSGVRLITSQTGSPSLTIEVKGGSLQASGETNGIHFLSNVNGATAVANMKVSGNAMVKASSISTTKDGTGSAPELKPATSGSDGTGGIIWDGKNGTVYGKVELQEDLEIGEGESLNIPDGSSLNISDGKTLTVNGGELTGDVTGTVIYKVTGVSLDKTSLTLDVGKSDTLTATVEPEKATNKNVTWESSNTSVATVENGVVTAVGAGSTTIKATVDGKSAECSVTVNAATVPVTGVSLNKNTLELYTGKRETLIATVEPSDATNPAVNWSSDKPEVATVEGGTVTAKAAGTATITATAADSSGVSATCTVTVTQSTYSISADTTALDFGSVYTGYTQPAAQTVTITNTGNQPLTLTQPAPTTSFEVGTLTDTELTAGEKATFTVQPKAGLAVGTYSENITVSGSEGATVTIPAGFTVEQRDNTPYYGITVNDLANGTVTCYAKSAAKGAEVTLTVKPDVGYALDKLTVTDASGKTVDVTKVDEKTYTFVMPGSKVTVEAVFAPSTSGLPFTDVSAGDWFYGAVKFVYENGLMDGVAGNLFAPNATLNRAMAVTILYRLEGSPDLDGENLGYPFADVDGNAWYGDAVYWARCNGIVDGVENNHFDPTGSLTREQMATVLYRYAQYKGADVSASGDLSGFADSANVSSWAVDAVKWAVGTGLVNGVEGNALAPQGTSTRAQAATVLMRFVG